MHDDLGETDLAFGHVVSEKYIHFAHGIAPWDSYAPSKKWGVYTPDYNIAVRTEEEDDSLRRYSIWDQIEGKGLMTKFFYGCKFIIMGQLTKILLTILQDRTIRQNWADI